MREFERAFQAGYRFRLGLQFLGLIEDQHQIYNGFTEHPAWRAWLEKVESANRNDREVLRERFPELFPAGAIADRR